VKDTNTNGSDISWTDHIYRISYSASMSCICIEDSSEPPVAT